MVAGRDDVLVFANHPNDDCSPLADVIAAANARLIHGMEVMGGGGDHRAWWDQVLANLDDQAGACSKIVWGIASDDSHPAADIAKYAYTTGAIPTPALNPAYADRRVALRDMIRTGAMLGSWIGARCEVPAYTLESDPADNTALRLQVDVTVPVNGNLYFYGCRYADGSSPGTLLRSLPLTGGALNSASCYFTTDATPTGTPLTAQQKANIKYIRVEINAGALTFLQPVRITSEGEWWNGPDYVLAGTGLPAGPSPYPAPGAPGYATVYFSTHTHSWMSDGEVAPWVTRRKYYDAYGAIDPTRPRFSILTDHSMRMPYGEHSGSVVVLKEGVHIYGGFAGGETQLAQRDPAANTTIIDAQNAGRCVSGDGATWTNKTNATLDGFTLTRGRARGGPGGAAFTWGCGPTLRNCTTRDSTAAYGGGVCCSTAALTLADCRVGNNTATVFGGGVFAEAGASAKLTNCTVSDNTVEAEVEYAFGGGIGSLTNNTTVSDSRIVRNSVSSLWWSVGGGIGCFATASTITRCTISGNDAIAQDEAAGGGVYLSQPATLSHSFVTGNATSAALGYGGGAYCASAVLLHDTFSDNASSTHGGGLYVGTSTGVSNNIVALNSSGIAGGPTATLKGNCVFGNAAYAYYGVTPGSTDISVDPSFAERAGGDYHLSAGSPCENAGQSFVTGLSYLDTDVDGQPRICGGSVDIGADERMPRVNVGAAKLLGDTYWGVGIQEAIVTACPSAHTFYIEAPDRVAGMRVRRLSHGLARGDRVYLEGVLITPSDGMRELQASRIQRTGTGEVEPLGMSTRSVGGQSWNYDPTTRGGQQGTKAYQWVKENDGIVRKLLDVAATNNLGLLVRTWGNVTYSSGTMFYVDDGTKFDDGSTSRTGVRVNVPSGVTVPQLGSFVIVTGISCCNKPSSTVFRYVSVRDQADIAVIQ